MSALAGLVDAGPGGPRLGRGAGAGRRADRRDGRSSCAPSCAAGRAYLPAGRPRPPGVPPAARRRPGAGRRPGPLPHAGPPDRAVASRSAPDVRPLPGACATSTRSSSTDLGVPPRRARRPDRLGRPGRDAAQPGPHRAARARRRRTAAAAGRRSPTARSPRWYAAAARSPRSSGAATPSRSSRRSGRSPGSSRRTRRPLSAAPRVLRLAAVLPGQPAARRAGRRRRSTGRCLPERAQPGGIKLNVKLLELT